MRAVDSGYQSIATLGLKLSTLGFQHLEALIFDMDGVLVDASQSYRAAAVATVSGYVRDVIGHSPPSVDDSWVDALKSVGGLNNDWDLTSALVRGVLAEGPEFGLSHYATALKERGGGLNAVDQLLGPLQGEEEIDRLGPGGTLKRYFQEHYLGASLFSQAYNGERQWYRGESFIDREVSLVTPLTLRTLVHPKGIATGRPRIEADYVLERFEWGAEFGSVVTRDCVIEGGGGQKPHPWSVMEAARLLGNYDPAHCAYIGDQPDDMQAARAAGCTAIGCADIAHQPILVEAGAEYLIESVNDLPGLLTS